MKRVLLSLTLALLAWQAPGEALAPAPALPAAGIDQRLAAPLPLDMPVVDSEGDAMRLSDALGDRPTLLVLGYYRCPQLCGLAMHGLLASLQASRLPRESYRIVGVSIDPQDTPATAAARRASDLAYADFLEGSHAAGRPLDLRLLTARPSDVALLARRVGFRYETVDQGIAHAAAAIVVTPEGKISRYLMGLQFDPQALRLALVDASAGRIGTWTDRVALLCAHLDPRLGRHTDLVLALMKAWCIALACGLAGWLAWLSWRGRKEGA